MATKTLFTVPVLTSPTSDKGNGSFICTTSAPGVYLLTFTSPPDNRLTTGFLQAFLLSLDIIEFSYPPGVVITTSGIPKFYSNGLDIEHVNATKDFFQDSMFRLFVRLATYVHPLAWSQGRSLRECRYPMPTVALINGHAFAGGFMVAMYHDYRIFNPSRGYLCLNELDLGMPLQPPMSSVFREKTSPQVYRALLLEAKRFGAKEALEGGLVDALGTLEDAMRFVAEKKLTDKGKTGVYGLLKTEMYRETLGLIGGYQGKEKYNGDLIKSDEKRQEEGKSRVAEWERNSQKAKL
jgi:enoyl-CoA hydratase/carnithine racemase